MCDDGRLTHHEVDENRIEWARQGRGDAAESVGPRIAVERAVELLKPLMGKGGLGIYISAQSTLEEAAAALLVGNALGAERYFMGGKPAAYADDFLIRADKNPNSRGVRLAAEAFGVRLEESAPDGVKALFAMRTDGIAPGSAQKPELFVAVAQHEDEATRAADVTLPCMSAYEEDGSFVNWYGRLQRIWPAVPARRGDAAPGWLWAERILAGLGFTHGVKTAAAAFQLVAGRSADLADLTLERIPDDGVVLPRLLPREWPARAPRPAAPAEPRGPQTTPPGTKVGDEASGGSR
jgi:NADH-quinone oxidoreductase subunit G